VYGVSKIIRSWLEGNDINDGIEYISVGNIVDNLLDEGWFEVNYGSGSKSEHLYDRFITGISPFYGKKVLIVGCWYAAVKQT